MSTIYREYELTYTVDASQAVPALNNIAGRLATVDRQTYDTRQGVDALNVSLHQLATTANSVVVPSMGGAQAATKGLHETILGMAGSFVVFELGQKALEKFGELANSARQNMRDMAEEVRKTRDDFRELANLKGADGPDDEVIASTIAKGQKTGMMPGEARQFMEQFQGSLPAGLQKKHITEAVAEQVAEEGMRFGTRTGLSPSTSGDFAGVMSQYGKINNVEEGAQVMGQVAYGLNEGRGRLEPLMRSLIKTAGAVAGDGGAPIGSLGELAALQGVASTHASPDAAGTKIRKAVNELRDFNGKQGDGLRRLKIKPTDTYIEALRKITPGILAADASGKGGDQYLMDMGFNDVTGRTALIEQARDLTVIEERLRKSAAISGASVMGQDRRYLDHTDNGISRKIKATKAAQEYARGRQQERLEMAREATEIQMRESGEIGGLQNNANEWVSDLAGLKPFLGFRSTRDRWKDERSFENAHEAAYQKKLADGKSVGEAIKEMGREFPASFNAERAHERAGEIAGTYIKRRTREGVSPDQAEKEATAALRKVPAKSLDALKEYWLSDSARAEGFNKLADTNARGGKASDTYANNDQAVAGKLDKLIQATQTTNAILSMRDRGGDGAVVGLGGASVLAITIDAGKAAVAPTR